MTGSALKFLTATTVLLTLAACGGASQSDYDSYPGSAPGNERILGRSATIADKKQQSGLFGDKGLDIFGSDKKTNQNGGGIGVNSFLWRATLDTLSFMPLSSADPFGGVIITDWYSPPETPNERFKVTGYILGTALRTDALKVSIFRQVKSGPDQWTDATVESKTVTAMEDAILTRARQLRIDSASQQ